MLKRAKSAASDALVCEIDISVHDKGDLVVTTTASEGIGQTEELHGLRPQPLEFILAH
jgi:hypothetical protein